ACLLEGEAAGAYDPIIGSGYFRVRRCLGWRSGEKPMSHFQIQAESRHGAGEKIARNLAVDLLRVAFRFDEVVCLSVAPAKAPDGGIFLSMPDKGVIGLSSPLREAEIRELLERLGYIMEQYDESIPECENSVIVDRHTIAGETLESIREDVENRLKRFTDISISYPGRKPPFLRGWQQPVNHPFTQTVNGSVRKINGRAPLAVYRTGPSDANIYAVDFGFPTVAYGTYGGNAHARDEWVLAESVTEVKNTVREIISRLEAGA
ncbi:MAG: hypothetical protein PHQ23_12045, partial [Candidatus Wallbacteria bacterium]|nr:hypothetical protein [Candidatus Wallbacteria bacterium]